MTLRHVFEARIVLAILLAGVAWASASSAAEPVVAGKFSSGDLFGWNEKVFSASTVYDFVTIDSTNDSTNGSANARTNGPPNAPAKALRARANSSASGLFREIQIDLNATPCLTWSWKVDRILPGLEERTKAGDDYPARVYVIFSGGLMMWKTRALSYVWSGSEPKGAAWPNAYTAKTVNVAVQSGAQQVGKWVRQSRNVRDDFKTHFGQYMNYAQAVAVMSDTDNSKSNATAYYGDIKFTDGC